MKEYNEIIRTIENDYIRKQDIIEEKRLEYRTALYQAHNTLEQLDKEMITTRKRYTIQGDLEENQKIIKKMKEITQKKEEYAKNHSITLEYKPTYECEMCKDTGKVKGAYINGIYDTRCKSTCICFKQKVYEKVYNSYNIVDSKENLNDFNTEHLNTEQNLKMGKIIKAARDYILDFNEPEKKNCNICFLGITGAGKTKMCKCICRGLYERGITTFLATFSNITNIITTNIAQKKYDDNRKLFEILTNVDFLVIDDLGAENVTEAKTEKLMNILDTRKNNNKVTAFTSNLDFDEIKKVYGERITSRLKQNAIICNMDFVDYREKDIQVI
jgi:DNA replication protein